MRSNSSLTDPSKLHRLSYATTWAQAVLGGILLAPCWPPLTHGVFAVLAAGVLLCVHKLNTRGARIAARSIVGLFWVLAVMLAIQTIDAFVFGFTAAHVAALQDGVCWFGGLFLCYLAPVTVAAALYHGENTAVYDRLTGCVILPAQIGTVCMAVFTDASIPWTVGGGFLPYVWLVLIVVATIAVWTSVRVLTPAQQVAIDRRRQKRLDRIEKKKNGVR